MSKHGLFHDAFDRQLSLKAKFAKPTPKSEIRLLFRVAKIKYIFRSSASVLDAKATSRFSKEILGFTAIQRKLSRKDIKKTGLTSFLLGNMRRVLAAKIYGNCRLN